MTRRPLRAGLLLLAGLPMLATVPAAAQAGADTPRARAGIHGRLLDDRTGQPVADARITLIDGLYMRAGRTVTGPDGTFHFGVTANDVYSLRAEREGYRRTESAAISLSPGHAVNVELRVARDVVVLAPLTVVSAAEVLVRDHQLAGFRERRERQPFGRYLGRDEIERINPFFATDVLQHLPRVQVESGVDRHVSLPASYPSATGGERCVPNVYVDGTPVRMGGGEWSINQMVSGRSLEAVEMYDSPALAPGEFPAREFPLCGVLVLWTRIAVDRR